MVVSMVHYMAYFAIQVVLSLFSPASEYLHNNVSQRRQKLTTKIKN